MRRSQRKIRQLPAYVLLGLSIAIGLQLLSQHFIAQRVISSYQPLSRPSAVSFYRVVSLGSEDLLSYLLLLNLQLHDSQKGRYVRYSHLDYTVLVEWLRTLYELNPESGYPAFLASRVYSQTGDKAKIRKIIELIERLFDRDPVLHWRRMTEACLLAKHKLGDLDLALLLAQKISALPPEIELPYWARDMQLVILDELNELESAQLLISSMLESGAIKDRDELKFLQMRLLKIQQTLLKSGQ